MLIKKKKKQLPLEKLILAKLCRWFSSEICVFVPSPREFFIFLWIFLWNKTHSEKSWKSSRIASKQKLQQQRQTLEIVEDFAWELSKITHFPFLFSLVFACVFHFFYLNCFFQFFFSFVFSFCPYFSSSFFFKFFFSISFFPFFSSSFSFSLNFFRLSEQTPKTEK